MLDFSSYGEKEERAEGHENRASSACPLFLSRLLKQVVSEAAGEKTPEL
jgi:hypothetical protein